MNIDTDTQWATWAGIMEYYKQNEGYLQGQIGNPEGDDKPNKKYYDPRLATCRRSGHGEQIRAGFSRVKCCKYIIVK